MDKFLSLFDKKVALPISLLIMVPFLFYLGWELYWSIHVGYAFIKWHTHLMPYFAIGLAIAFIIKGLYPLRLSQAAKKICTVSASLFLGLFVAEALLTITGICKTYKEKIYGTYASPYTPLDNTHYHIWPANRPHTVIKPYYSFWYPTNSLGFADREWSTEKKFNERRILAMGDSFTEGDGAPYDSSYVASMRHLLLVSRDSSYVMNGGICGSDPFYNYINVRDLLLPYKPDFIIQSVSSSDMEEILFRGGMERFQKDGTLHFAAPWWEPLYAMSYVSRVFFSIGGYDEQLRKGKEMTPEEKAKIEQNVKQLFTLYTSICRQNNIKLIVVLHPEQGEVERNKYNYDLAPILHYLSTDLHLQVVDLLPSYRSYISQRHTPAAAYFWKYDGHHNSRGYEMMAETTLQNIGPMLNAPPVP